MNQHKILLLVLLLVQMLFAAWLFFGDGFGASDKPALVSFEASSISAVEISDNKDNKLRLERLDGSWRVGDYPADSGKVDAMLAKLSAVQAPWPIATSTDTQTRFEVAQGKFQRHLQLYQGDDMVTDLLFGTSPGFRRVHARAVANEAVYSIDFANHELPVGEDDWLDRGLLALGAGINSVQRIDHFSLSRGAGPDAGWELNGGPADPVEAAKLVDRFASLQVLGTVVFEGQLTTSFVVTANAGESNDTLAEYRYALYHNAEIDKYYITRDDQPGRFELANYIAEQTLLDAQSLAPKDPSEVEQNGTPNLAEELIDQALQGLPQTSQP